MDGAPILVIEDDAAFVRILTVLNRQWGLPLEVCSTRRTIQQALAAPERYALIVADRHVPGLDLVALLRQVRATHARIPLVVMSSLAAADLRQHVADLRPDLVATKDEILSQPADFAARLQGLLERHGR